MSKRLIQAAACGFALAVCVGDLAAGAKPRVFGDGGVLATIPQEASYCAGQPGCNGGYPEGVAVVDDRVYVAGPATFGTIGKGPSVVTVIAKSTGRRLAEIPIQGENTDYEHALSGITVDGNGNVYALSTQLGVVRIERHGQSYTQSSYATALPDLPACVPGGASPCSPTPLDLPPISNEMTFDERGYLYITDSLQATIFRVAPGGGAPEPWFQSPLLAGNLQAPLPFGANGIKLNPERTYVYVIETFDPDDLTVGHVYRIPLVDAPAPADIELFATFPGFAAPDSLVFGKSGRLYVSLAGSSQIAVLDESGAEITRISGPGGSAIPLDGPATMAFDDPSQSLLVANHAIFGNPSDWSVLRIFVDEKGDPYPNALHGCH
ncbi:SMP-30/gluconolactonase/LRE family protein [uncultured Thiodictyon sp.]|uniref:SMP-30/gluconolactonase/LRE family protein n=1 Tax=uncultured Thiodictyon sp. TaxID=1846217 RepID=UPI0025EE4C5B|nr:SMP-30/gluconolactonase/LRE family protein [uncultured Thiodictyon sp.]